MRPATSSFSFTVRAAGTRPRACGWGASASAGSSPTSTRTCGMATASRFSLVVGDATALPGVKFVITLDTDTQLPRDSARQFIGAMAHPLNRPRFGPRGRPSQRGARDGGLRHPAAAGEHQPARRESLVVRAPARGRPGHRSLHARRLRRLPGRVRRGLVHRQGHLRRRRLRARARRPLSREPHPEPRPARRVLCPRRRC